MSSDRAVAIVELLYLVSEKPPIEDELCFDCANGIGD